MNYTELYDTILSSIPYNIDSVVLAEHERGVIADSVFEALSRPIKPSTPDTDDSVLTDIDDSVCKHEFVSREYHSQPFGTCLSCNRTVFIN